ncbi:MAG TPA: DUF4384 domain-containing protein [Gemmatimonadales bacterium]|nr:DUF4384 domain-containing protein [Gemmatimonadales bacterium]
MLLPILAVALQLSTPPAPAAAGYPRPVRVWLGSTVLTRGTSARVFVRAAQDGNLIVLHRRTDGRLEVLFPSTPSDDPYVTAGTYEIQAAAGRAAFTVAEPDGSGLVLAALAPARYRFDEFVREAAWNPDALAPTWNGADGEGVLSDIVQRMLGDGYFNYDIATYTVAPPVYAMQQDSSASYPTYPNCTDCTFIGYQENVFEPLTLCDAFFAWCLGAPVHHFGRANGAPAPATTSTIALAMRTPSGRPIIPQNGRAPTGFVRKNSAPVRPPVGPRSRKPIAARPGSGAVVPIIALRPGRAPVAHETRSRDVATRRRYTSAPPEAAAPQTARLTLSPTAVRDEPERAPSTGTVVLTGVTVTRPVALVSARENPPSPERIVPRAREPVTQPHAPSADAQPRARALAVTGGTRGEGAAPTPTRGQSIALPPAVFRGAQARSGVGMRRR